MFPIYMPAHHLHKNRTDIPDKIIVARLFHSFVEVKMLRRWGKKCIYYREEFNTITERSYQWVNICFQLTYL